MNDYLLMQYSVTRPLFMLILTPIVAELVQMVYNHLTAESAAERGLFRYLGVKGRADGGLSKKLMIYLAILFFILLPVHLVGFSRHQLHWSAIVGLSLQSSLLSVVILGLYAWVRKIVPTRCYATLAVAAFILVAQISGIERPMICWLLGK